MDAQDEQGDMGEAGDETDEGQTPEENDDEDAGSGSSEDEFDDEDSDWGDDEGSESDMGNNSDGETEEDSNTDTGSDSGATTGDAPVLSWHIGQGTNREEHVHEGHQTADGGYIAVGHHAVANGATTVMLVIKVDAAGDLEWQTQIGDSGVWDVGIAVQEVADGYVVGGGRHQGGAQKPALIKLDPQGDLVWESTYGGSGVGMIRGIEPLENGNLALTGFKNGSESGFVFIADESQGFVMEVSPNGAVQWEQSLDVPQGTKLRQTADGGLMVLSTAWVESNGADVQNATLIKTDANGSVVWRSRLRRLS